MKRPQNIIYIGLLNSADNNRLTVAKVAVYFCLPYVIARCVAKIIIVIHFNSLIDLFVKM